MEKKIAASLDERYDRECGDLIGAEAGSYEEAQMVIKEAAQGRKRGASFDWSKQGQTNASSTTVPAPVQRKRSKSNDMSDQDGMKLTSVVNTNSLDTHPENTPASTPQPATMTTLGDLLDSSTRKLHTDLILTMNSVFADYDFSSVKATSFRKEPSTQMVINAINNHMSTSLVSSSPTSGPPHLSSSKTVDTNTFLPTLWGVIGDIISLSESDIYTYIPEVSGDPFSEDGVLWSFNYFCEYQAKEGRWGTFVWPLGRGILTYLAQGLHGSPNIGEDILVIPFFTSIK